MNINTLINEPILFNFFEDDDLENLQKCLDCLTSDDINPEESKRIVLTKETNLYDVLTEFFTNSELISEFWKTIYTKNKQIKCLNKIGYEQFTDCTNFINHYYQIEYKTVGDKIGCVECKVYKITDFNDFVPDYWDDNNTTNGENYPMFGDYPDANNVKDIYSIKFKISKDIDGDTGSIKILSDVDKKYDQDEMKKMITFFAFFWVDNVRDNIDSEFLSEDENVEPY